MLNVPTLWAAFVINFLALGLIWAYIFHSYPSLEAARYWTGSAFAAVAAALIGMAASFEQSLLLLSFAGTAAISASCLLAMGVRQFYGEPVRWRQMAAITAFAFAGFQVFTFGYASANGRILIYSAGLILPMLLALNLLLQRRDGRINAGARLAGFVAMAIVAICALRAVSKLLQAGGDFNFLHFNAPQAVMVLALIFLSMVCNFGFLLMAMDRLRNEVADLALMDDLTGVGNRRQLLQRLTEECARSDRSKQPFALLVIDIDNFKTINDTHGHAAGDACLQHFTLMAQTRLRPGDLLARTGGDEFCIMLPASTLREGAVIARRIIEVCREDAAGCVGNEVPLSVSVGVAQWTRDVGAFPDRLIAAADHALYVAKKEGRDRFSVYEPVPTLVPDIAPMRLQA
ncbi:MAG TPA: GGDEF domain-containing protein [Bradyrhizobium sp.]|uniref:GGDEF domain-containing protein n=1 Tax=Bradyrhizobium sp. TaxID=376 RepID=UPI002D7F51FE|nr:GGDEF domain-containing protein [Bradyrhizobium sp.]HET7886407.1 GGDEF domain-containing protein [Bradyrhizobium sp.]